MLSLALNPGAAAQVQVARRAADQAQSTARQLEERADQAQRSADNEQARADGLSRQAADANQRWGDARNSATTLESGLQRSQFNQASTRNLGQLVDAFA